MNWTEIYRDAVSSRDILLVKAVPPEGVIDLGECPVVNCPPFEDVVLEVYCLKHDDGDENAPCAGMETCLR